MKPGDLVRKTAGVFARTEMSLLPLDRAAAAAGLRASGARGVNAPRMETKDAAALILMVLAHTGGVSPEATAARVKDIWDAKIYRDTSGKPVPRVQIDAKLIPDFTSEKAASKLGKSLLLIQHIDGVLGCFANVKEESGAFGACLAALLDDCIGEVSQMRWFLDGDLLTGSDREKFQIKIVQPYNHCIIEFSDGDGLSVEYEFRGAHDTNVYREITTTQEMTVLPLLRIAKAFQE
jgi:hypothetical protein